MMEKQERCIETVDIIRQQIHHLTSSCLSKSFLTQQKTLEQQIDQHDEMNISGDLRYLFVNERTNSNSYPHTHMLNSMKVWMNC